MKGDLDMNKILKGFLIALGAIAALVLLCVGLYSIGFLDLFIFFILPGVLILVSVGCLLWNILKAVEMKKQGMPVPQTMIMSDKIFYRVLAVVLAVCVLFTAGMVGYTVYAHRNCSIIGYIANEK